jgi:16S rRNA (cytidine1402-2'-O)-methyltransferase
MPEIKNKPGKLYIVATPIGNLKDITLRALEVLRDVNGVICEEQREGSTLLKRLNIQPVELITLNEHNELTRISELIQRFWQGDSFALISDCGTPVFADPGTALIEQAVQAGIEVIPIPGPSSLMSALSILDVKLDRFIFAGFLPRQPADRRGQLTHLRALRFPLILMDTPYRLQSLLDEISDIFGSGQSITLACNLTYPNEKVFRGPIKKIIPQVKGWKAEFILILHRK